MLRLHAHRVTHRALVSDRILLTDGGRVMLLDPGNGDVAAGDLQLRLDVAQLITELALRVGPDRSADLALDKLGADELVAVVPLLQPIVLYPSTRAGVRHHKDVLPALRKRLLDAAPGDEVPEVRLERIRPRTLLTLVASVVAVYLLAGELARASLGSALRSADWRWGIAALALSALTYVGAALSLSGFVAERLSFVRTVLAQLAGSFVTLVTPAAVGGVALNIRYLQRRKVPAAVAAASVAVSQVVAFVLHILLLVMFAALAGTSGGKSIRPPTWVYFVLAGLVVIALVVLAIPAGRRMLRARLAPTFGQVAPRLLAVAQQPRKLAEGVGGALLLSLRLHRLPRRVRPRSRRLGADRERGRGLPDRQRAGVHRADAGRARSGGSGAYRRAPRRGRGGRGGGQRGAAVPAADLLASRARGLGRAEVPGARQRCNACAREPEGTAVAASGHAEPRSAAAVHKGREGIANDWMRRITMAGDDSSQWLGRGSRA